MHASLYLWIFFGLLDNEVISDNYTSERLFLRPDLLCGLYRLAWIMNVFALWPVDGAGYDLL